MEYHVIVFFECTCQYTKPNNCIICIWLEFLSQEPCDMGSMVGIDFGSQHLDKGYDPTCHGKSLFGVTEVAQNNKKQLRGSSRRAKQLHYIGRLVLDTLININML